MSEELFIPRNADKKEIYESLYKQLKLLTENENDMIANMANISAALKEGLGFFWVGFYRVLGDRLILGPFQGPIACTSIKYGKGVCGKAWKDGETVIVPDVDKFPGHIACSSLSRSEIVIPLIKNDKVIAVLDVDSDELDTFDETDAYYLEKICELMV